MQQIILKTGAIIKTTPDENIISYIFDFIRFKLYSGGIEMKVNVIGGTLSQEEQDAYVKYITGKHPDKKLTALDITIDGDYADLKYYYEPRDFERIRRITGYLVGTLDNWNNGKRAEERDRVKHDVSVMEEI